jgi:hypothetical protein
MLSLAGPSPSLAAPTKPAETDRLDGIPCGKLCKAYMAWSNRILAAIHPSPSQPQRRIATRPKRPDRPHQRASAAHHAALKSFAQLPQRSDPAPPPTNTPQVEAAATPDPITPTADQPFSTDENATARSADAGSAINESPEVTPVSLTAPVSATQDPATAHNGPGLRLVLSLVLALTLFTLMAIMFQKRSRDPTKAASTFR